MTNPTMKAPDTETDTNICVTAVGAADVAEAVVEAAAVAVERAAEDVAYSVHPLPS